MSNKKSPAKSKASSASANPKTNLRVIAIAVAVLIVALIAIIWLATSAQKPAANTPAGATPAATSPSGATPAATTGPGATPAATSPSGAAPSASKQYAAAPPMSIDPAKQYTATVKMAKGGEFVIQLYANKAPITVNSFVFLARQKFFDGVTFHRVLEGFMAQGGDPTGTGGGGPGYKFVNEDSDLKFDKAGVVAMANAGRNTNGSQFFITFGPTANLNGGYTIFGQVTSGMDVVNAIKRRDPDKKPAFTGDVIESILITEK